MVTKEQVLVSTVAALNLLTNAHIHQSANKQTNTELMNIIADADCCVQ